MTGDGAGFVEIVLSESLAEIPMTKLSRSVSLILSYSKWDREVLRDNIPDVSVGLVYGDPPSTPTQSCSVVLPEADLDRVAAQIQGLEDTRR